MALLHITIRYHGKYRPGREIYLLGQALINPVKYLLRIHDRFPEFVLIPERKSPREGGYCGVSSSWVKGGDSTNIAFGSSTVSMDYPGKSADKALHMIPATNEASINDTSSIPSSPGTIDAEPGTV